MDNLQSYSLSISKEQLSELPRVEFPGIIRTIDTAAEAKKAVAALKRYTILGFDTESKPTFKKGISSHVSLIQIAADDICFLFRIRKMDDLEPLREIIEDAGILKIGLSLHDDFNNLSHNYSFKPAGFVDLQKIVPDFQFGCSSLQKIYAILFDMRISKSQQLSNWDAAELSEAQMSYAAIDAWACIRIYRSLMAPGFNPATSKYKIGTNPDQHEEI